MEVFLTITTIEIINYNVGKRALKSKTLSVRIKSDW